MALDWPRDTVVVVAVATIAVVAVAAYYTGRHAGRAQQSKARTRWRAMSSRSRVDVVAGALAVFVFVGATTALMLQPLPSSSDKPEQGNSKTTTTTVGESGTSQDGPSKKNSTTKVVEREEKANTADTSLLGRTLDNDASIILFRLGVALFAAFLTGLVVQRVGLGKYAFKFGPLDVPEVVTPAPVAKKLEDSNLQEKVVKAAEENEGRKAVAIASTDPGAATLTLGGELEAVLRTMADPILSVDASTAPLPMVIEEFGQKYGLDENGRAALHSVFELGDRVEKGAPIGEGLGRWLVAEGQYLPAALESLELPGPNR